MAQQNIETNKREKLLESLSKLADEFLDNEWVTVCKRMGFDSAHFLPNYEGKCRRVHGHHWGVEIAVLGPINKNTGMVIDFTILSNFLLQIKENLDHHLLNDVIENPTAENIVLYVRDKLGEQSWGIDPKSVRWIKVWESEDSYAMWEDHAILP